MVIVGEFLKILILSFVENSVQSNPKTILLFGKLFLGIPFNKSTIACRDQCFARGGKAHRNWGDHTACASPAFPQSRVGVNLGELGSNLASAPHVRKDGDFLDEPQTAE